MSHISVSLSHELCLKYESWIILGWPCHHCPPCQNLFCITFTQGSLSHHYVSEERVWDIPRQALTDYSSFNPSLCLLICLCTIPTISIILRESFWDVICDNPWVRVGPLLLPIITPRLCVKFTKCHISTFPSVFFSNFASLHFVPFLPLYCDNRITFKKYTDHNLVFHKARGRWCYYAQWTRLQGTQCWFVSLGQVWPLFLLIKLLSVSPLTLLAYLQRLALLDCHQRRFADETEDIW